MVDNTEPVIKYAYFGYCFCEILTVPFTLLSQSSISSPLLHIRKAKEIKRKQKRKSYLNDPKIKDITKSPSNQAKINNHTIQTTRSACLVHLFFFSFDERFPCLERKVGRKYLSCNGKNERVLAKCDFLMER